jgi:hypothetical protein
MECSYAAGFADSTRAELLPLKGEQKMLSLRGKLAEAGDEESIKVIKS